MDAMLLRRRFAYALGVFAIVLAVSVIWQFSNALGDGDSHYAICGAQAILSGQDLYSGCLWSYRGAVSATYPLTTSLYGIAFLFSQPFASALLFATSSFLLAFGLLQHGERWKLLVFLSAPFLHSLDFFQWSPLIAAIFLLPNLLPLALAKPTLAMPVLLLRLNRYRLIAVAAVALLSLTIDPTWPLKWWNTSRSYDGFIPLLTLPFGPLLLLALLRWKDEGARLLFLMALVPQRGMYELVPLLLIPRTRTQMLYFATMSLALSLWHGYGASGNEGAPAALGLYLAGLPLLLLPTYYPMIIGKLRSFLRTGVESE